MYISTTISQNMTHSYLTIQALSLNLLSPIKNHSILTLLGILILISKILT